MMKSTSTDRAQKFINMFTNCLMTSLFVKPQTTCVAYNPINLSEEIRPLKITIIFKHVIELNNTATNMHGQSILLEQALPVIISLYTV